MGISVTAPDGSRIQFPDGTDEATIAQVMSQNFPSPQAQPESISLADVPGQALANLPASAAQFGSDLVQPFMQPIETAKSIGNIALGGIQKLIPGEQSSEKHADAVGEFFKQRYGGWDAVKQTMATDPVGFLADISTVISGGGTLAARAPGVVGKVGQVAQTAGRAVDPVTLAGKTMKPAADILGVTTGTGGTPIRAAARAGYEGGPAAEAFRDSMRGNTTPDVVVDEARMALGNMRQQRGLDYNQGMAGVKADKTALNFAPIEQAINRVADVKRFKGVELSKSTEGTRAAITDLVNQWKALDPAEFHTPEGLDALKQAIGDIRDSTDYGTPSRVIADQVYHAVRGQITSQAPQYAKVMKNYEQASSLIKEIEKTLSLNPRATIDTQLRKLQSVMRNDANTNYGRREQLAQMLQASGATHLMERLAGQSMNAFAPRGLARAVLPAIGAGAWFNPAALAMLPAQSPRLVGEASYLAGRGAGLLGSAFDKTGLPAIEVSPRGAALGSFQAGRLEELEYR